MKALLVQRPERDGSDLYLFYETAEGRLPVNLDGNPMTPVVGRHSELPRTAFLPTETLDALRGALIGDALDRDDALADCREVRDRLLSLVERGWDS